MKKEKVKKEVKDIKGNYARFNKFCDLMFSDKTDKGDRPYTEHLFQVASKCYQNHLDGQLVMIAYGHDLFEDTDVTPADLVELGINARVIKGISDLTKRNGQGYEEYKLQVKSNPDAIKVKIADLEHNMDITRLKKPLTEKDLARVKRYHDFWLELKELDK